MTATPCAIDGRPTQDGWVCSGCLNRAAGHLAAIVALAPDARLVAAGLVRRGGGGSSGKPGSRPPLNDGATDALDEVQNTLTTLARDIAETRGLQSVSERSTVRTQADPLVTAAKALSGQLEWLRHAVDDQGSPYAVVAFAEIDWCAMRLRSLVNGPSEQKYLGPCGAETGCTGLTAAWCPRHGDCVCADDGIPELHIAPTLDDPGCPVHGITSKHPLTSPCEGDIYAPRGGTVGRCRTCGAEVAAADREAWLDGEVRAHAFRAVEISRAYPINIKTIRSWVLRGQLVEVSRDRDDKPLYNLGDALDLAAADAARRAGNQATRARRKDNAA